VAFIARLSAQRGGLNRGGIIVSDDLGCAYRLSVSIEIKEPVHNGEHVGA
jgi:hypothetical protein